MIEIIAPYLSAISTVLGLTAFLLIIWSAKRQPANQESAELPFDLPDEFTKEKK